MATAIPNIIINSISGKIGGIVFYTRRSAVYGTSTLCVRSYVIPRNPDTEAQRVVRLCFADAVRSWQSMTDEERYVFTRKARFLNMSGYNLYISKYMKTEISGKSPSKSADFITSIRLRTLSECSRKAVPSVSKPYIKGYTVNAVSGYPKLSPG